jgi:SNF2 family DNA or RNA helicase
LDREGIVYSKLSGSTGRISNIIKKYDDGDIPVLLLNAKHFGSGLNLQMTTDIIIFHRMSSDLEKQVIGRGQRLGRTSTLNVTYLCYDNEMKT